VLVVGEAADSLARQTGGWTLSWQGADNSNADFPGATSLWAGLRDAVTAGGGQAVYSPSGAFTARPDVAIVVFGETPYAEFQGDQADVALHPAPDAALAAMRRLKAAGVPVVAVLLSGRPLYLNPEINAADAFIAAWLPGSEGEGLADVLVGRADGAARHDFRGRLSFSWPKRPDQTPLNPGQPEYDPQFAFGYGLSYADRRDLPRLAEAVARTGSDARGVLFADGRGGNGFGLVIGDAQAPRIAVTGARTATYGSEALTVVAVDRRRQEDARQAQWSGAEAAWLELRADQPIDLAREANGAMSLVLEVRSDQPPTAPVRLELGAAEGASAALDVTAMLAAAPAGSWGTLRIPLSCFGRAGADLAHVGRLRIETAGRLGLSLSDVRVSQGVAADACPAPAAVRPGAP
jgi:beta-glucosidase